MAEGPDFIVDPSGKAQDVRHQKSWRWTVAPTPGKAGNGSSGNGKGVQTYVQTTPKPKNTPRVIVIPVGLILMIILYLFTGSFDLRTVDIVPSDSYISSSDFEHGNSSFYRGEYDMAIAYFNMTISSEPDFGEAYNNRGIAYHELGENDNALVDFDKAIQLLPDSAVPYNNRAVVYLSAGDYDTGFADLDKALELDPKCSKAYYNRGLIHLNLGNFDDAIADFDKAIEFTPESTSTKAYQEPYSNNPLGSMMANESRFTQSYTDLPLTYTYRGYAHLKRGDSAKAFADLDKAIWLRPDLALAYYYRGVAHCSMLRFDEGIVDLKAVLVLNNDPTVQQDAETYLEALGVEWP